MVKSLEELNEEIEAIECFAMEDDPPPPVFSSGSVTYTFSSINYINSNVINYSSSQIWIDLQHGLKSKKW